MPNVEEPLSTRKRKNGKPKLQTSAAVKNLVINSKKSYLEERFAVFSTVHAAVCSHKPANLVSTGSDGKLDAAAVKLQKVYKGYQIHRNLADRAVAVEELLWKALDFAALSRSSVTFFDADKSETASSRWARARTKAAKVGKGLSKDEKAQKLALRHWLEAIDPRHRYGHNLHVYYNVWFEIESCQPFFYWLDIGNGKEIDLDNCPRTDLQSQCIKYLGPKERETYEVIVENGKLVYGQSRMLLDTVEGTKWIFVLSTSRKLYVGQKKKGKFQHSSFLAGGATVAAGRLVVHHGVLEAIWSYSGHYRPTEENFVEFINYLKDNHVDLTKVKKCPVDDDVPPCVTTDEKVKSISLRSKTNAEDVGAVGHAKDSTLANNDNVINVRMIGPDEDTKTLNFERHKGKSLSCKWTTEAGPRIGCVIEYPTGHQFQALEQVNVVRKFVQHCSNNLS